MQLNLGVPSIPIQFKGDILDDQDDLSSYKTTGWYWIRQCKWVALGS